MAYRSHSTPRRAIPDGVPPGVVFVGFPGASVDTGQTGDPDWSDLSGRKLRRVQFLRVLALSCVDRERRQQTPQREFVNSESVSLLIDLKAPLYREITRWSLWHKR